MDEVSRHRLSVKRLGLATARVGDGVARRPVEVRTIALSQLRIPCLLVGPVDLGIGSELVVDPEAIDPSIIDVRNGLIRSYLTFIMYVRPKIIFFENVRGFTLKFEKNKSKGKVYSEFVLSILRRLGYEVDGKMLDFSSFGIPQKRTRFILVGIRKDVVAEKK